MLFSLQRFHWWNWGEQGGFLEEEKSRIKGQGAQVNSGSSGAFGHLWLRGTFAYGGVLFGGLGVGCE